MAKPELEFFDPGHLAWREVVGSASAGAGGRGVREKILSLDPATGDLTRLLRFETIAHEFWEEVWILDGDMIDVGKGQTFSAGMYACRPPGMRHGPYRVASGCTLFETRYRK